MFILEHIGKRRDEPDDFLVRNVAHVPDVYHAPGLIRQPRRWPRVETTRYPFPEKGVPGAVGSGGFPGLVGSGCFAGVLGW